MRKVSFAPALAALAWFALTLPGCGEPPPAAAPPAATDPPSVAACRACHPHEAERWDASPHGRHAVPVASPPGGADAAVGSRWMQAYLRRDAFGLHRIQPTCYDLRERRWRPVTHVLDEIRGGASARGTTTPEEVGRRAFETDCAGCHASGTRLRVDPLARRMAPSWRTLAIDCEACHGTLSEHAAGASAPVPRLAALSPHESVAVCARCHGGPQAAGDYGPTDAAEYVGVLGERAGVYADGVAAGQIYQYPAFVRSRCFREGGLTCLACHDAHGPDRFEGAATDRLCTGCHAGYADESHTHHPPASTGARCIECHMPRLLGGLMAHQRDHRIGVPVPALSTPDACSACHADRTKAWTAEQARTLWGPPPGATLDAVAAVEALQGGVEASDLLLAPLRTHPDPFYRAVAAAHASDLAGPLSDPLPEVRLAALDRAIRDGAPEHVLRRALADPLALLRAKALLALGQGPSALTDGGAEDLVRALRQERALPGARLLLARHALAHGRPEAAAAWLEEDLAYEPLRLEPWLLLEDAWARAGRAEGAAQVAAVAGRVAADLVGSGRADVASVLRLVEGLRGEGRTDAALRFLDALLEALPHGAARDAFESLRGTVAGAGEDGAR